MSTRSAGSIRSVSICTITSVPPARTRAAPARAREQRHRGLQRFRGFVPHTLHRTPQSPIFRRGCSLGPRSNPISPVKTMIDCPRSGPDFRCGSGRREQRENRAGEGVTSPVTLARHAHRDRRDTTPGSGSVRRGKAAALSLSSSGPLWGAVAWNKVMSEYTVAEFWVSRLSVSPAPTPLPSHRCRPRTWLPKESWNRPLYRSASHQAPWRH